MTAPTALSERVQEFMDAHVFPNEATWDEQLAAATNRYSNPPILAELRSLAKSDGLWNLFMPGELGAGLTQRQYAPLAEIMGHVSWAPQVFNCNAPDSGNMELLAEYADEMQRERWLAPLLAGEIQSAYLMTEPDVASSDATNIRTTIERDGGHYVVSGRKWFATGVMNENCRVWIVMGRTVGARADGGPDGHTRHTQIIVEPSMPGISIVRALPVLGSHEAPHGHAEVMFDNVRVPAENVILGEGRGFEIAQGRLGPGRIHHCMRTIGLAERALAHWCARLASRSAFGHLLADNAHWEQQIAEARTSINMCRLLTLDAAEKMDTVGNKVARAEVAMIKVAVPRMARRLVDQAIQAFGAAGLTDDYRLAEMYRTARWISIADGPDEVHNRTIARIELKPYRSAV